MIAGWTVESPAAPGGVGLVRVRGEVSRVLAALGLADVQVSQVGLRQLAGVGGLVVARWASDEAELMPHGGVAQVAELVRLLGQAGATTWSAAPANLDQPGPTREQLQEALQRVKSPRGVELLLDQPRRWELGWPNDPLIDRMLNRLMAPPLVAIVGPANVGKSTLTNALSGAATSIVADEPGTTRDHVGVSVEVDGLVIRLIDCPGLREVDESAEGEIERLAIEASLVVASRADLVILAADPHTVSFGAPSGLGDISARSLRVSLRADLAGQWVERGWLEVSDPGKLLGEYQRIRASQIDHVLSVHEGYGVEELKGRIRRKLVPDEALEAMLAWRFWVQEANRA